MLPPRFCLAFGVLGPRRTPTYAYNRRQYECGTSLPIVAHSHLKRRAVELQRVGGRSLASEEDEPKAVVCDHCCLLDFAAPRKCSGELVGRQLDG